LAILLSLIPSPDEPRKVLVTVKVLGAAFVLIGLGVLLYWAGKARRQAVQELGAKTGGHFSGSKRSKT
jgi:hypothetical protein